MTTAPTPTTDAPARRLTDWHRAMIVGLIAYVVSRLCVLAGAGVRASQMVVDARKLAGSPAYHAAGADRGPHDRRGADVVGRPLVPRLIRHGYPSSIPANITYEQDRGTSGVLPGLSVARPCRSTGVLPGGDTLAAIIVNFVLGAVAVAAGRPARPGAVRRHGRLPGDGAVRRVPRQLRAVVHVLRGDADRARCGVPAVPPPRAVVARRHRRACSARQRDPTGLALVAACAVASFLAIRRSRDWMLARRGGPVAARLHRLPVVRRPHGRRARRVVPGAERGVEGRHELRRHRGHEHRSTSSPTRSRRRPTP